MYGCTLIFEKFKGRRKRGLNVFFTVFGRIILIQFLYAVDR